jgi:hypothetical protein
MSYWLMCGHMIMFVIRINRKNNKRIHVYLSKWFYSKFQSNLKNLESWVVHDQNFVVWQQRWIITFLIACITFSIYQNIHSQTYILLFIKWLKPTMVMKCDQYKALVKKSVTSTPQLMHLILILKIIITILSQVCHNLRHHQHRYWLKYHYYSP